jgi:5-hydroxyisourate hydrolase
MGRLTTHILDTARGGPAANVEIRLYSAGRSRELVTSVSSNDDGRTPQPLLDGDGMATGTYELEFDVGAYFRALGVELPDPAFLDTVVVRFSIRDDEDYHVPLLVSPWSYSTYRGS